MATHRTAGDHDGPRTGFAGDALLLGTRLQADSAAARAGSNPEPRAGVKLPLVFLGPSLKRAEAASLLAAEFRAPARHGDIYRGLIDGYTTIVLIDGEFHGTPSVWQREIVDALAEGVAVHGASSMGALRAAELHGLGMVGHGQIFAWYRDGAIDGDDEVALTYGPAELDYPPLSAPLVNIRATLAAAVPELLITAEEHDRLIAGVKSLYFPERCFAALLAADPAKVWPPARREALSRFLVDRRIDQKRLDSIAALTAVAAGAAEPRARPTPASPPHWWRRERLVAEGFAPKLAALDPAAIARRAGIADDRLQAMRQDLSTMFFIGEWARSRGIVATAEDLARERTRFPAAAGPARRVEAALAERALAAAAARAVATVRHIDRATARRAIVLEWASDNGIEHPDLCGEGLVDWVIEATPRHFGYLWQFSVVLIEALELLGCAGLLRLPPPP